MISILVAMLGFVTKNIVFSKLYLKKEILFSTSFWIFKNLLFDLYEI